MLVGDKIVCTGYVALFKLFVEGLGHCRVNIIRTKCNKDRTHIRALIYVKDDKYRVDGNYIFDVTFDSKVRDDEDISNDYYFFLRTLEDMNKSNSLNQHERVDYDFLDWAKIEELMEKLPDEYTEEEFNSIIRDKEINYVTILVSMHMKPLWIEKSGNKKEDLLRTFKLIYESFNRRIDHDTIIKLFYNVRKIEYYLDPKNTSFTYEDLFAMVKSYLASPHAFPYKPIEEFRKCIFYGYFGDLLMPNATDRFIETCLLVIGNDIEKVKLTRNLREYLLKKQ